MRRTIPTWAWIAIGLAAVMGGLTRCRQDKPAEATRATDPVRISNARGDEYAGSGACLRCHGAESGKYVHTAHALSSGPAERQYIRGNFETGSNVFSFNDYSQLPVPVQVVMEADDSAFFQTTYINGVRRRSERFGVVIGSGKKAQSYLYWRGNQLLQLPVSYFSATESWANSPGFPADQVKYNRLIPAHCIECHATVARLIPTDMQIPGPNPPAFFDRKQMIYGIGCENCHGPGAKHVAFQTANPQSQAAKFIVNPAKISRQRRLDICAACHSGVRTSLRPAFSFEAGDDLAQYYGPGPAIDTAHSEVHGNQIGLLEASKCFRASGSMECRTCHAPHEEAGDAMAVYSRQCMSCHQPAAMVKLHRRGGEIRQDCINCHMPVRASSLVTLMVPGKKSLAPLMVRSHLIAVYAGQKQP